MKEATITVTATLSGTTYSVTSSQIVIKNKVRYVKVTSFENLSGEYLLTYENGNQILIFDGTTSAYDNYQTLNWTPSNKWFEVDDELTSSIITISNEGSGKVALKNSNNKYLNKKSSGYGIEFSSTKVSLDVTTYNSDVRFYTGTYDLVCYQGNQGNYQFEFSTGWSNISIYKKQNDKSTIEITDKTKTSATVNAEYSVPFSVEEGNDGLTKNDVIATIKNSVGTTISGGTVDKTNSQFKWTPTTTGTYTIDLKFDSSSNTNYDSIEVTVSAASTKKVLSFNLSSNPGGWPTSNSTTLTNYTYTLDGTNYTFALKNVKCNSGYLMLTNTAVLGLPAISGYKLTKIVASTKSGASASVYVGISSSASSESYITGGGKVMWSNPGSDYTYNLTSTSKNTMYYMYVTNKNAQITNLELTYE